MLKSAAGVLALNRLLADAGADPAIRRRVRPRDPAWPTPRAWAELHRAVGGGLLAGAPLLGACDRAPDGADCAALLSGLANPFFVGDQPGGTQVSGWLDAWTPAPSAYVVKARNASDVAAAVNFARRHDLRLVVKGGGHSYQGTSNAPDSLLIWTRAMNDIVLHDAFVGQGCAGHSAPVRAVSAGAGAMWIDLYDAVTTKGGRYVQGGGCTTVGVAGLIQSGGFGSFSKRFGLGAAGLLEAEIVTADGRIRTVNACRDPDLFWALKGGGGGNWGAVTRLTLATHDLPENFGGAQGTIKAASDEAFRELLARFFSHYAANLFNPHWGEQVVVRGDNTLKLAMVCQGLDKPQTQDAWQAFFDWVAVAPSDFAVLDPLRAGAGPAQHWWDARYRKAKGGTSMIGDPRPGAPDTHAWWSGDQDQVGAFLHGYDSLWLPARLLDSAARPALCDALFAASRFKDVELHFNKGLAGAPPDVAAAARETAMNPMVADAFALAIVADGERPAYPGLPRRAPDLGAARVDAQKIATAASALRRIAPGPGSYVSESNYFDAQWPQAFWGANYSRLRAIKSRYDPDGLFFLYHGVGSEGWSADGFVRTA